MYNLTVPVFEKSLGNMSAILDKTAKHCTETRIDPAVLMSARLYPDMLPFTRQILIACDHAKGASARLAGVEVPKYDDNEQTFDELKARIVKVLAFVKSLNASQFDGSESRTITITLRGEPINFVGLFYLTSFALPNFTFISRPPTTFCAITACLREVRFHGSIPDLSFPRRRESTALSRTTPGPRGRGDDITVFTIGRHEQNRFRSP
jgi:hypothetical protein